MNVVYVNMKAIWTYVVRLWYFNHLKKHLRYVKYILCEYIQIYVYIFKEKYKNKNKNE
jgi:hypothetical protein